MLVEDSRQKKRLVAALTKESRQVADQILIYMIRQRIFSEAEAVHRDARRHGTKSASAFCLIFMAMLYNLFMARSRWFA